MRNAILRERVSEKRGRRDRGDKKGSGDEEEGKKGGGGTRGVGT